MDDAKRNALIAKRAAMRGALAREADRRALWGVDEALIAARIPFRLHHRDEADQPDWLADMVPNDGVSLDWRAASPTLDLWFAQRADLVAPVLAALGRRMRPDETMLVVPGNGAAPMIQIAYADFAEHAGLLLGMDGDLWLSCPSRWLIEIRGERVRMTG